MKESIVQAIGVVVLATIALTIAAIIYEINAY
jgi:hypothetical protein